MAKRRAAGEGTIRERRDGRWEARLTTEQPDGRARLAYFYGRTQAEVRYKLDEAKEKARKGLPVIEERQTVEQFLNDWLENTVKPNRRPRTYEQYEILVRLHIVPTLGKLPLSKLAPQRVQSLLAEKQKQGLAGQTVRHVRTVLRRALNRAVTLNLVARNSAALVEPPPMPDRSPIRFLSADETRALLKATGPTRLVALYTVTINLGLRRGELLGLRWSDVDLENETLRINQSLQRVDGKLQVGAPKTKRSRRTLVLIPSVVRALKEHRTRQLRERLVAGSSWKESGLVFTTKIGTAFEPRNLDRHFKAMLTKAELPDIPFHNLRHSTASLLLQQGCSLRVIQEILGHSTISTTADIYSHVAGEMVRDAAEKIGAVLA
jgi:integrase